MSASLVGSEMCIRDRDMLGPGASGSGPARAGAAFSQAKVKAGKRTYIAVSYTHLTLPTICSV
eukprot:7281185-Alexandrium_andersonii.AAC.1